MVSPSLSMSEHLVGAASRDDDIFFRSRRWRYQYWPAGVFWTRPRRRSCHGTGELTIGNASHCRHPETFELVPERSKGGQFNRTKVVGKM